MTQMKNGHGIFRRVLLTLLPVLALALLPCAEAQAQNLSLNLDGLGDKSAAARMIQIILVITVLSLAPSILVMVTSFTRIIVVLSLLRTALGTQQTPPNQVLIALALFLTAFVMAPVFDQSYKDGIVPLIEEDISEEEAIRLAAAPFHTFMLSQVRDKDLELFVEMLPEQEEMETPEDTPYQILVPAFMISELRRAFEIGFLLFVPFLIIDMLVASILMAMGMMMLPPVIISLPFKLIFFVLVDGWHLVAGSLVKSFGT
jgi:flagellar biosynthetic protein FliP